MHKVMLRTSNLTEGKKSEIKMILSTESNYKLADLGVTLEK